MKSEQVYEFTTIDEIKHSRKHAMAMGPFGSNITVDNFVEKGIPVIRGINLKNNRFTEVNFVFVTEEKSDQLISSNAYPEDIVFTHRGTLGQVVIIPKNSKFKRYVVSQSQMKLSCDKSKVNPSFVYHYFCSPQGQNEIYTYTNTTGVPSISSPLSSLKIMKIPHPKLQEQDKIVKIFDDLDNQIQNLQNQNKILEQTTRAIFKSCFIDFDGVTEFENSELGRIPKGWSVEKLQELCISIQNGGTPKRMESTFWDNGAINWYKTGELRDNFLLDSEEKITELGLEKSSTHLWPENTILFAIYAFPVVGRMGILTKPGCSNQAASGLIPKNEIGTYFLFSSLIFSRTFLGRIATGAAQQNISQDILKNHIIILPPILLISKFNKKIEAIFEQIKITQIQIQLLTKIRNILLPKLMSGEIRV